MTQQHNGFTIVELLIVIVVIAILAAISIVAFNGIQSRARDSSRAIEVAQWKKASETYKIKNGIECPSNFAFVYGNSTLGTSDFCVMKYEAKNVGGVPTAQASGTPWVSITQPAASSAANATCSGCHLITESEWMTVVADALLVKHNWSGGEVGSGYVYSGHNDNSPANAIAASSNDEDGYFGTGNSSSTGNNQRRTLYLKSGDVVWDMAGNVSESTAQVQAMSNVGMPGDTDFSWRQWTTSGLSYGNLPSVSRPAALASVPGLNAVTTWNSSHGIGQLHAYYSDTATRNFARGGTWYDNDIAGVMKLYLKLTTTTSGITNGFRVAK